jgi:hypothetical protein
MSSGMSTTTSSRTNIEVAEPKDSGALALISGIGLGVLWSAGVTAFLLGYTEGGLASLTPRDLAGIAFIGLAPSIVFAFAGWALREIIRFAGTARVLDFSVKRLSTPVAGVKGDARALADAVAEQAERINRDADATNARLSVMEEMLGKHTSALEEVLRTHTDAMQAASKNARAQVDALIEDLRRERAALGDLSEHLTTEAAKMSEMIERQTDIVSTATRVAANQAEEGRGMLDRSATAMSEAAGNAQRAAEKAALAIDEQLRDMQALVTALEERGGRLEEVARIHSENVKIVQQTTHELNLAAETGADSMKSASEAAVEQARRVSEVIEKETQRAVQRGMEEIERMRRAAQAAREAAESAGLALEANADAVIERVRNANAAILESDRAAALASAPSRARAPEPAAPERRAAAALDDDWRDETPSYRSGRRGAAEIDRTPTDRSADIAATSNGAPRGGRRPDLERPGRPAERSTIERPLELDQFAPPPPSRDGGRRSGRYSAVPPSSNFDEIAREEAARMQAGGAVGARRADVGSRSRPIDDLDDDLDDDDYASPIAARGEPTRSAANGLRPDAGRAAVARPDSLRPDSSRSDSGRAVGSDETGEWRWRDLLKNIDEAPTAMLSGEAVVTGLRRAGVDPARALDPDMTARVARARRRAGSGEARALVLDGALNEVRRTSAALAADPTLRGRAEEFVGEHARLVRRAIDENDAGLLSSLLDSDMGRAYLLLDAALAAD